MRGHKSFSGRNGEQIIHERRFCGVWFFVRYSVQKWSPLMDEIERERGVRFGSFRLSVTQTRLRWNDGKEPATEKKTHSFA